MQEKRNLVPGPACVVKEYTNNKMAAVPLPVPEIRIDRLSNRGLSSFMKSF